MSITSNPQNNWSGGAHKSSIRVSYVSDAKQTPAIFGSLQLKFNNVRISRLDTSVLPTHLKRGIIPTNFSSNSLVFFNTKRSQFLYGAKSHKGEHINFLHLLFYLIMFNPDINLFFSLSVYICNFLGALSVFTSQGHIISRCISVIKSLVAYNVVLLGAWLLFSSINFELVNELINEMTKILQFANSTGIAALVRSGVIRAMYMPYTFIGGFVVFFNIALVILQKLGLITYEHQYEFTELLLDNEFQPTNDISQRWIQRLATPELWLQPLVPNDYIDVLPVWEFSLHAHKGTDKCENDRSLSAHRTSSTSPVRTTREHSRGRSCHPNSPRQTTTLTQGLLQSIRSYMRGRSPRLKKTKNPPTNMRKDLSCAICLDNFTHRALVCGLPCSHVFHHSCILEWLYNDKHCCPVCRWPAFKQK